MNALANIGVSDHAIVRYLERALGMDIEQLRREIVTDGVAAAVRRLGDGKYPIGRGVRIVVRNHNVVTVEYARLGREESHGSELDHDGRLALRGHGHGGGDRDGAVGIHGEAAADARSEQEGD